MFSTLLKTAILSEGPQNSRSRNEIAFVPSQAANYLDEAVLPLDEQRRLDLLNYYVFACVC